MRVSHHPTSQGWIGKVTIKTPMSKCPVPENMRATHPLFASYSKTETEEPTPTTSTPTTPPETSEKFTNNPETSDNMMPAPNQRRGPGQTVDLPTSRVRSSIPRGDFTPAHQENADVNTKQTENTDETKWIYPSEQMFFNAMKRKGWGPKENDMPAIIAIHNGVNERAWLEVMKWERMHSECKKIKLHKFMGRPKDLSPRARVNMLMGYNKPFDRHDWIVDRCGTKVRYIIDFYVGQKIGKIDHREQMFLDTRPAFDSFGSMVDRTKMWFDRNF